MITRTGKIARYHETQYYFKQAYIKWDYKSIPVYEEILPINLETPKQLSYTNVITNKGTNECAQISKSIYQYVTEDDWKNQKVHIDIKASTQVPLLLKFIFYSFEYPGIVESFNDQFPVDETIEVDFKDRIKFGDVVFFKFKNKQQPNYQLSCPLTDVVPEDGLLGVNFVSTVENKLSFDQGRTYTNTINQQTHKSLITIGTVITNIISNITPLTLEKQGEDTSLTAHASPALSSITNSASQKGYNGIVLARKHVTDLLVEISDVITNFSYTNSINLQSYTNPGG